MPRRAKGPRLWLRPPRRDSTGKITHNAAYFIRDDGSQIGTGFHSGQRAEAEQALGAYIAEKHRLAMDSGAHDTTEISIVDVVRVYTRDRVPEHARPEESARCLERILNFFGRYRLAEINGQLCRRYMRQASSDSTARRDLGLLMAAIGHHRKEGLHDKIVSVVLPPRRPARERWLTRQEAARLLWAAWRRPKCKHIARFIVVALYTGRRASVVCGASFQRERGRPWIDLTHGYLWPPEGARITKKRNPPIPLPPPLMVHLRIWERHGRRYAVEWSGEPVLRVQTLKRIAQEIGLGDHVTPHILRHTAATWQMMAGTDMFEAGKYLGMTARTLESVYAKYRPEHLSQAKTAYRRLRRTATVSPPNSVNRT